MVAVQITRGLAGLGTRQDLQAFQPKLALCPPRFLLPAAQTTSTLLIDRAFVTRWSTHYLDDDPAAAAKESSLLTKVGHAVRQRGWYLKPELVQVGEWRARGRIRGRVQHFLTKLCGMTATLHPVFHCLEGQQHGGFQQSAFRISRAH